MISEDNRQTGGLIRKTRKGRENNGGTNEETTGKIPVQEKKIRQRAFDMDYFLKPAKTFIRVFFVAAIASLLFSCDRNLVFEEYREIKNYEWNKTDTLTFSTQIKDTLEAYNLIVKIRNGENYPYRNVYLFLTTIFPDGKRALDTLDFQFYEENGNPLGKCSGDICNNSFLLSRGVHFDQAGIYRFQFNHAMRSQDGKLPYIMNFGLRIETDQQQEN
jgi:gliding motility-associated lipoprotein GldH